MDHFWQDIVYENIPTFYFVCGRLGHKDMQCSETAILEKSNINLMGNSLLVAEPDGWNTPWKRVSTKKTRPRGGMTKESNSKPGPTKISSPPKINISNPIILSSNGFQPLLAVNLAELDTFESNKNRQSRAITNREPKVDKLITKLT